MHSFIHSLAQIQKNRSTIIKKQEQENKASFLYKLALTDARIRKSYI